MKDELIPRSLAGGNDDDNNNGTRRDELKCAAGGIWTVIGKRWALMILKNLSTREVIRFNELKKALSGISSTVLSERLLELERSGLVKKKIYPEIPPRVEYSLTAQAKELEVILKELDKWCGRWKDPAMTKTNMAKSAAASSSSL